MYIDGLKLWFFLPVACFGFLCLAGGFVGLVLLLRARFAQEQASRREYQEMQRSLLTYAESLMEQP